MKTLCALIPVLAFLGLSSCLDKGTAPAGPFDSMILERTGGGDLAFTVTPVTSQDTFQVTVTRREFRDTTIQMFVVRTDTVAASFNALRSVLNGDVALSGDFTQSTLPTGSWVRVYMMKGDQRFEVKNAHLREALLPFESIVKSHLT